jgi:DNA-binding transcriptional regulator YiaG
MYLEKHKLSHLVFAQMIGVTSSAVGHWFKGRRPVPETVIRLIRFFDANRVKLTEFEKMAWD